jgi:hypothetical protein
MGFGFTAEAQRSLRGAKEDGKRVFTAKGGKGPRFEEVGRRGDGGIVGFFAGFAPRGFLDEAKRGGAEGAEEECGRDW